VVLPGGGVGGHFATVSCVLEIICSARFTHTVSWTADGPTSAGFYTSAGYLHGQSTRIHTATSVVDPLPPQALLQWIVRAWSFLALCEGVRA
jgi:hypothetical protein